ncbi:hypothetical protein [Parasitella parasitica]|uniref:DNA 3'-5' helicase n=1 Tax=Parasitella parasitica TaxID=35722 RepID=A0A0B7NN87_9FUNG|nr:hypothetical protein [Parasitella parasitica]
MSLDCFFRSENQNTNVAVMNTNYKEHLIWYENTVKPYAVTPITIKTRVWHASATKPHKQSALMRRSEYFRKVSVKKSASYRASQEQEHEGQTSCVWTASMIADDTDDFSTLLEFDSSFEVDKDLETTAPKQKQRVGQQEPSFMDSVAKVYKSMQMREKPDADSNRSTRSPLMRSMSESTIYFDASNEWESEVNPATLTDPDDSSKTPAKLQQQRIEERLELFQQKAFIANQLDSIYAHLGNENHLLVMPSGPARDMCYLLPATLQQRPHLVTIVIVPSLTTLRVKETNPSFNLEQVQSYFVARPQLPKRDWWITTEEFQHTTAQALQKPTVYLMTFKGFSECTSAIKQLHQNGQITRFVLEDAHCFSQWGPDFHFGYLRVAEQITSMYPNTPITALTAVSNERVLLDIVSNLQLQYDSTLVFKRSILL